MYGPANIHSPNLAQYGIFVSNSRGPGVIDHSYASNMADAAYYVGACQRQCNTTLDSDTGTNSALGYSGTNSGGRLLIQNSVFTMNRTGLAPNSLNNDDAPPPQDGRCPGSKTKSCEVIQGNLIADNNNANAPTSGLVPAVGAGVEIAGGAFDTVTENLIVDQGAWGVVTHDFPDPEKPPAGSHCQGGVQLSQQLCLFTAHGNLIHGNELANNGFFGNVTNGDLATVGLLPKSATPRNCFFSNRGLTSPVTSEPANIQSTKVDGKPCGAIGDERRRRARGPADLRHRGHRTRPVPQGLALSPADPHLHRADSQAGEHAEAVRRRPGEPLLQDQLKVPEVGSRRFANRW
jgi:hypothetical protein